jgi:hypothetical protein
MLHTATASNSNNLEIEQTADKSKAQVLWYVLLYITDTTSHNLNL